MAALAPTIVAMIRPNATNSPTLVSSIVVKTEPKSKERYHSRSVHTLVKMAKTTIRIAAITNVGRIALRRPDSRRLLTRLSPRNLAARNGAETAGGTGLRPASVRVQAWRDIVRGPPQGERHRVVTPFQRDRRARRRAGHEHAGGRDVPPGVPVVCRASTASRSVATSISVILVLSPARSSQFAAGNTNTVAPSFSAEAIFSWIPPIAPTSPFGVICPVPATCLPLQQRAFGDLVVDRQREDQAGTRAADPLTEIEGDLGLVAVARTQRDADDRYARLGCRPRRW